MEKLKELSLCEFYQFKLLILEIKIEKLKMFNIQLFHINHFNGITDNIILCKLGVYGIIDV